MSAAENMIDLPETSEEEMRRLVALQKKALSQSPMGRNPRVVDTRI